MIRAGGATEAETDAAGGAGNREVTGCSCSKASDRIAGGLLSTGSERRWAVLAVWISLAMARATCKAARARKSLLREFENIRREFAA